MNNSQSNKLLVPLCLVVLLPLLPVLFGYFPAIGDIRDVFIPLESFFREQQLQGNIPSWNPAVSFGFPVLASAQIGFFYPVLFILRYLPIYLELPLVIIIHICAAIIGTFLFARKLKMSNEGATLTALSFVLSQFIWQHTTHLNIFLAITWFPWQMLAIHTIFQKRNITLKNIATLSLIFGIPFLIGQLQMQLFMMIVGLVYGMCIKIIHSRTHIPPLTPPSKGGEYDASPLLTKERLGEVIKTALVPAITIAILALLIVSVQLFPTLELTQLSSRATLDGFDITRANQYSYPLYHLPTILFPRFYGNDDTYWGKRLEIEYGSYIGVLPLMLVAWYLWQYFLPSYEGRRGGVVTLNSTTPSRSPLPKGEKSTARFFIILLSITFLLSLGSLSPFRLLGLEPSLWFFSAPARWLLFTTFAASMLAGFALDALQHDVRTKRFFKNIAIIIFAAIIIGNIFLYSSRTLPFIQEKAGGAQTVAGMKLSSMFASAKNSSVSLASPYTYIVIISLFVIPLALNYKHAKQLIIAVAALDLVVIAATTTPFVVWKHTLAVPETTLNLPENIQNHNARVYSLRDGADTGAYFTNPSSRPTLKKRELQKSLLLPLISSQFNVYGVEWPASLDLTSQARVRAKLPEGAENLAIGAILSADSESSIHVQTLTPKPRVELVGGEAQIISETPSSITIKTTSTADGTLIVRDTFYPGWHAYVDGSEVEIHQQEPFFRSVQVPSGDHVLLMKYVPKLLYVGGAITLILLLICAIIMAL